MRSKFILIAINCIQIVSKDFPNRSFAILRKSISLLSHLRWNILKKSQDEKTSTLCFMFDS